MHGVGRIADGRPSQLVGSWVLHACFNSSTYFSSLFVRIRGLILAALSKQASERAGRQAGSSSIRGGILLIAFVCETETSITLDCS